MRTYLLLDPYFPDPPQAVSQLSCPLTLPSDPDHITLPGTGLIMTLLHWEALNGSTGPTG